MKGIGGHTLPNRGAKDEWLTPPEILKALGPFDLDPCAPVNRPWDTAAKHFTIEDDGLSKEWDGRVWLNPPYGPACADWLRRMADHKNGTALIFARTETEMFHRWVWPVARAVLFFEGRLYFHHVSGARAKGNAGGPSVLIAYSEWDASKLQASRITGRFVRVA